MFNIFWFGWVVCEIKAGPRIDVDSIGELGEGEGYKNYEVYTIPCVLI